jgi:hypothetical protein
MAGVISMTDMIQQIPQKMRRGVIMKVTNESVFMRILQFITCEGMTYQYGEFSKLPGVAFRALGGNYTADSGVVNPKAETMAILGGSVQTDHQLVENGGDAARANAIMGKSKKAALFFDKYCIDGDPNVDPKQFLGLKARLINNQLLSMGADGGNLTLAMVNKLLDAVAGKNNQKVLLMNKEARRQLKALILTVAGGASVANVGGSLDNYDGATIEELDEDGDEAPILPQTEVQGASGAVCCSMYCVRPGKDVEGEYLQGLIGNKALTPYPSGMVGTQHIDIVEGALGIAVFHGRSAARLKGIKAIP